MSVDASPPVQPPQLSPDGKWVWDGSQWQPVVGVDSGRGAVFPSWNSIEVPAAQQAMDAVPLGVQYQPTPQYQPPAVDYSYAAADEPIVPLWKQPRKARVSVFLYPVAGLAVLVMAMMVLNSVGYIQFPWNAAGSSNNTPSHPTSASPTPDFSGPDSVRADRFLNKTLAPAVAGLEKTITPLNLHCYKTLVNNCYDAISVTEPQVKNILAAIQNGDIPKCLAPQMAAVQSSADQMDKQLQVALSGFQDTNADELYTGMYRFNTYHRYMQTGIAAATQATKSCHTVVLPTWVP
ncbi:MAG TPA: hypothetical protein VEL12_07240 [Candidatus Nitrosopolaris sp.]|nr:hypothetical protein [Candidatus Nitrosopolaris sp.]